MTTADIERENICKAAEYLPLHILAASSAIRKARNCLDVGARLGSADGFDLVKLRRDLEDMLDMASGMEMQK